MNYYNKNASQFAANTLAVDMSALYAPFVKHLPTNALILDAGCGAGRDAKVFAAMAYDVTAFDASEKMVEIAQQQGDFTVEQATFLSFKSKQKFDGIWACASLLHVSFADLPRTFKHLAKFLSDNGVFYVSFKYGENEIKRDGRHFTNCNEKLLSQLLTNTGLVIFETWCTADKRPGRESELWLNALLKKDNA